MFKNEVLWVTLVSSTHGPPQPGVAFPSVSSNVPEGYAKSSLAEYCDIPWEVANSTSAKVAIIILIRIFFSFMF